MRWDLAELDKSLVTLAIEKALLDVGSPTYDRILELLYEKYRAYLPDCYLHPEYLKGALEELLGNAGNEIIRSITVQLKEFSDRRTIAKFLEGIVM